MNLPGTLSSPSSPELNDDSDSATENDDDRTYLPEMKPVFLPPPFTPSNQVFIHLADVANKQSLALRSEAEERIRNFIKAEAAGVLDKEKTLRSQVLCFWKEFKQHLGELQSDLSNRKARSPTRLGGHTGTNGLVSAHGIPSSLAIRSFTPTPMSSVHHPVSPQPRISALSASLATSTFHYPKESRRRSSEIQRPSPESNDDLTSVSSTFVPSTTGHGEEANVLQFKRTINDDINTQASYRYFVNLEEDIERSKRTKEVESKRGKDDQDQHVAPTANRLPAEVDTQKSDVNETVSQVNESQNEPSPQRGRDKGKRKVTFDVKPATLTIENDAKAAVAHDQGYFHHFPPNFWSLRWFL